MYYLLIVFVIGLLSAFTLIGEESHLKKKCKHVSQRILWIPKIFNILYQQMNIEPCWGGLGGEGIFEDVAYYCQHAYLLCMYNWGIRTEGILKTKLENKNMMRFRTQNTAICDLIALLRTKKIAGLAIFFTMDAMIRSRCLIHISRIRKSQVCTHFYPTRLCDICIFSNRENAIGFPVAILTVYYPWALWRFWVYVAVWSLRWTLCFCKTFFYWWLADNRRWLYNESLIDYTHK